MASWHRARLSVSRATISSDMIGVDSPKVWSEHMPLPKPAGRPNFLQVNSQVWASGRFPALAHLYPEPLFLSTLAQSIQAQSVQSKILTATPRRLEVEL